MTLQNLLTSIKNADRVAKGLLSASTGKKFELQIANKLMEDLDYSPKTKAEYRKHPSYKTIKEMITSADYKGGIISVPGIDLFFRMPGRRIIIHQPHGANNYPDFLLVKGDKVLPLEIKFSKENGEIPTWNSGYPRSKALYIFGSYGKQDITVFGGDDYLSQPERDAIISIMDYAENELKTRATSNPHYDENNFGVYLRRMYNQKKSSLTNPNRSTYETNSIALAASEGF